MKKKLIIGLIIIAIAIVVLVFPQKPRNIEPIQTQVTIGNLVYDIQLDKNQFSRYEEISVHTKVTNIGNETYTSLSGSSSCPSHLSVEIVHEKSKKELSIKPGGDCTADLATSKLIPNQTVEDTDTFIPKQLEQYGLKRAKTGSYEVRVALPRSNPTGERRENAFAKIMMY
ncbi:hypothetical protein [Paenibacillus sp. LjRoot56]|uniref:hypothetical protein n=1 Tax=Paenibacillus sp. LjRoot56 TaxID=3342333 RepID=UPI003ECD0022